jgi:hypothetical protein
MRIDDLAPPHTMVAERPRARWYVQTCPVCDAVFSYLFRSGGGLPPPVVAYHRLRPEGLGLVECFGSGLAGVQRGRATARPVVARPPDA